jgi:hypothetical protein
MLVASYEKILRRYRNALVEWEVDYHMSTDARVSWSTE